MRNLRTVLFTVSSLRAARLDGFFIARGIT
nr:MAG TPA: hypothetical protein [Caudoviricetes sp.]